LQFFTAKGSKGGPIIMTQVCTPATFTEFIKIMLPTLSSFSS